MLADFRLYTMLLVFVVLSFGLNAQCPPMISSPSDKLILQYEMGDTPSNLFQVDTNLPGANHTEVMLTQVTPTWQTFGPNFTGASMTGEITIYYIDGSSEDCEYIEGNLVGLVPVELSSFYGVLKNDNVVLFWTTESEKENAGFEVEQSFDGEHFSTIGMVNGAGDSEENLEYNFLDPGVRNRALNNTVYYRLAQIDFDGTKTFSEVVAVDLNLTFKKFVITKITGWNSTERNLQVHFYNPSTIRKVNFMVTNLNGRMIEQGSIYPETGLNVFEVDLSNDESPFYILSLNNGKEVIAEKVALGLDY